MECSMQGSGSFSQTGGFQLDWLCLRCFEACRQELGFVIDSEHPQWQKVGL
jgi:hypothetical protein